MDEVLLILQIKTHFSYRASQRRNVVSGFGNANVKAKIFTFADMFGFT